MITYPLDPPASLKIRSLRITPENANYTSTSPYTFFQQVQSHQGQMFVFEVVVAPMKSEDAAACEAWLTALRGNYGTFNIGDSARKTPRGTAAVAVSPGYAFIDGANQTGRVITTGGWANSQVVLKAGDYIQFGCVNEFTSDFTTEFGGDPIARLHKVLTDVTSDGTGHASIDIWPSLRSSPVNGATITTTNTKGTFRMAESSNGWSVDEAKIYGFSFKAIEAL